MPSEDEAPLRPGKQPASALLSRRPDRSCVMCHRKKIRCDRQSPCLACVKSRVECLYTNLHQPMRRVRKTTIADVASRISSLEKTIVAAASEGAHAPSRSPASTSASASMTAPASGMVLPHTPHASPPAHNELLSRDLLIRNGSSSKFFNELLISQVIEEDQDKSSLLGTPASASPDQDADSPFSLMGIISNPSSFDRTDLPWRLSPRSAVLLWQTYVQIVDPTIKVLHIPTDEVVVFTAIHKPHSVTKDVLALVSAIYFASAIALEPHEALTVLGVDRLTALKCLKAQFHQRLAEADMLENPTLEVLQGLAIYLSVLRAYNHGRGIWTLNGLAIRMAHSIGLHRDGSGLGFTPFEAEMRRRLWWHFVAWEMRASEDHGISCWSTFPSYDTRMPSNVDDSELLPSMPDLPLPKSSWTRMSLPLIIMEIAQTISNIATLATATFVSEPKEVTRSTMFKQLRSRVETYIAHCNYIVPIQRLTMQIALAMVHKIDFVTRQQLANAESPDNRNAFATEQNLASACRCLEIHAELWDDEVLRQYRWAMKGHPQYHMLLYVLWHLCVSPTGPNVSRAWDVVHKTFEIERYRFSDSVSAPSLKSVVMQRLRQKAEALRDSINSGLDSGDSAAVNQATTPKSDMNPSYEAMQVNMENADWSTSMENLPDWNTLVDDLHLDLHAFSTYF